MASSGASAAALDSGPAPPQASPRRLPALMKLGCQSAPANEAHLRYFVLCGVWLT